MRRGAALQALQGPISIGPHTGTQSKAPHSAPPRRQAAPGCSVQEGNFVAKFVLTQKRAAPGQTLLYRAPFNTGTGPGRAAGPAAALFSAASQSSALGRSAVLVTMPQDRTPFPSGSKMALRVNRNICVGVQSSLVIEEDNSTSWKSMNGSL